MSTLFINSILHEFTEIGLQKTRGNTKAREELSRQIESLSAAIMSVHEKSVVAVNNFQPTHRDELKVELKTSLELKERVERLVQ